MMGVALGVDVVDLVRAHLRNGPSERFVRRIYSQSEQALLARHTSRPDLPWLLWAAKEAAFKAVTLDQGSAPVFVHAEFAVEIDDIPDLASPEGGELRGRVRWRDHTLVLGGTLTHDRIVAWAVRDPGLITVWRWARIDEEHLRRGGSGVAELAARYMTEREAAPVHSVSSALARLAVRRSAADWLDIAEDELEVICPPGPRGRVPPELHRNGTPLGGVGISISHHGRWLAWGVGGPVAGEPADAPSTQKSSGR